MVNPLQLFPKTSPVALLTVNIATEYCLYVHKLVEYPRCIVDLEILMCASGAGSLTDDLKSSRYFRIGKT